MTSVHHRSGGLLVSLGGIAVLCALMVPARGHLSIATPALVLVVPVVAGVALGGFAVGLAAAVLGFLAYDLLFIPPYGTLDVGAGENWVALAVYFVVVLVVARLVSFLQEARALARHQAESTRRMYELADQLIADRPLPDLLAVVTETVRATFHAGFVVALLPEDGRPDGALGVAATAGVPPTDREWAALVPEGGRVHSLLTLDGLEPGPAGAPGIAAVALVSADQPVGLLVLGDAELSGQDRELLAVFAHQAAQAVERSRLRAQALRSQLLEESDRWRQALMGAVSHDLRTPLATVKTAVSTLRDPTVRLAPEARDELLALIEAQTDGLSRLVTDLLDLSRLEAGSLVLQREPTAVEDVVEAAVSALAPLGAVERRLATSLPPVDVDELLMTQALVNLLENALRHAPSGTTVEIEARRHDGTVELAVSDHGPGVAPENRQRIFETFNRGDGGGRAGLGLAIAKAFVEAHGGRIAVGDAPGGGARFTVSMAVAGTNGATPAAGDES